MKIALYAGSLIKGGTERVLVTLAHNFMNNGHEVVIVTSFKVDNEYPVNSKIERIISSLTEDEETDSRIANIIRRFEKLRRIWKEINPDVVLSFIGKNNFNALLTAGRMGIPVVVSVRADPKMEYPDRLSTFLANHLYPKASGVVLQTKDSINYFKKNVRKKVTILKNPINPAFFDRTPVDYADKENLIVAVGRVDENKNHEMLIRAFSKISDQFPQYRLKILGDGELRKKLITLTEELGKSDRIVLPGVCDDVPGAVERAKLFVLCSDTEGVPNTLLEAMAVGTAVISTDCPCGGPAEIIDDGINGYLTPVRNEDALADKMLEVLANEDILVKMSVNARKTAEEYREEKVAGEWLAYLKQMIKVR